MPTQGAKASLWKGVHISNRAVPHFHNLLIEPNPSISNMSFILALFVRFKPNRPV